MEEVFDIGAYVEAVSEGANPELGLVLKADESAGTFQVALFRESGPLPIVTVAAKTLRRVTLMVDRATGQVRDVVRH